MARYRNRYSAARATIPAARTLLPSIYLPSRSLLDLRTLEDRRVYHPLFDYRPSRRFDGGTARVVVASRSFDASRDIYRFKVPSRVVICARRQMRREVLFAKKLHRKGAGGARRRNYFSEVSCG